MNKNTFYRLNKAFLLRDLKQKMVFLTGPRQVGKTWLAKNLMGHYKKPVYLNYDSFKDRKIIDNQSWLESSDIIIFDEIHKMDQWKSYLKGVFDTRSHSQHILVTGSARLQNIARSGDSLAGRFFSHTLLPFSFFELSQIGRFSFSRLLSRGGFPEPLLISKSMDSVERWRQQYIFSLLREDIPDFKSLHNYKKLKTLLLLIRESVGSPISINSFSHSLKLNHKTVSKYISILEDLFVVFQIPAFSKNISRSLSKPKKIYFYDFAFVENKGGRLENMIALHLLKHCLYLKENKPSKALNLTYMRTKEQKEVDFLLEKKGVPQLMIEVKTKSSGFSKNLSFFYDRYGIKGKQLCLNLKQPQQMKGKKVFLEDMETFLLNLKT